jgi:hypothetical protein
MAGKDARPTFKKDIAALSLAMTEGGQGCPPYKLELADVTALASAINADYITG